MFQNKAMKNKRNKWEGANPFKYGDSPRSSQYNALNSGRFGMSQENQPRSSMGIFGESYKRLFGEEPKTFGNIELGRNMGLGSNLGTQSTSGFNQRMPSAMSDLEAASMRLADAASLRAMRERFAEQEFGRPRFSFRRS